VRPGAFLETQTAFEPWRWLGEGPMKKAMSLVLEDKDLVELKRVLMDDDAEGALAFLKAHLKGKARDLLEGG
jgi:hypothetical protein